MSLQGSLKVEVSRQRTESAWGDSAHKRPSRTPRGPLGHQGLRSAADEAPVNVSKRQPGTDDGWQWFTLSS